MSFCQVSKPRAWMSQFHCLHATGLMGECEWVHTTRTHTHTHTHTQTPHTDNLQGNHRMPQCLFASSSLLWYLDSSRCWTIAHSRAALELLSIKSIFTLFNLYSCNKLWTFSWMNIRLVGFQHGCWLSGHTCRRLSVLFITFFISCWSTVFVINGMI